MSAKPQQSDQSEYSEHQKKPFGRSRTSKAEAQKDQRKIWKCNYCVKEYQSYPALYTHSKQKHKGNQISSKGSQYSTVPAPVKKMKSILNQNCSPKEQLERALIMNAKGACLHLFQIAQKQFALSPKEVKDSHKSKQDLQKSIEEGKIKGKEKKFPQQLLLGLDAGIFKEYEIRVGRVSFGKQLLGFFGKTSISSQVYLQLMLLEALQTNINLDIQSTEQSIWNKNLDLQQLYTSWEEWKENADKLEQEQAKERLEENPSS